MSDRVRRRHIARYPFLHSESEVYGFFCLNYSPFVVRETYITYDHTLFFCSNRCLSKIDSCENSQLQTKAFHRLFKEISVLQEYCSTQQCSHCSKYLCLLDNNNLYAEPTYEFVVEIFEIVYTDLTRLRTVHH